MFCLNSAIPKIVAVREIYFKVIVYAKSLDYFVCIGLLVLDKHLLDLIRYKIDAVFPEAELNVNFEQRVWIYFLQSKTL